MHELSIAQEVVETVMGHLPTGVVGAVRSVHLKVGVLNRLTPDSLCFCFEIATRGTAVEGATLEIEETTGDGIQVVDFDLDDEGLV